MSSDLRFTAADAPDDLEIQTTFPQYSPAADDSLAFHAARLLLLLHHAGGRRGSIHGRLKLVKLDFFIRYPTYLAKALGTSSSIEAPIRPESPMIRYKYGPWDQKYYDVFAVLESKGLVTVNPTNQGDEFMITPRGRAAVADLHGSDFEDIVERCMLVYKRFGAYSGTKLKAYIYEHFPEIVALPLKSEI